MGIMYQNIPAAPELMKPVETTSSRPDASKKASTKGPQMKKTSKKRSFETPDMPLVPYRGIPKMTVFSYKNTDVFNLPDVTTIPRQLDVVWMMSHALRQDTLPMWVGFNATFCKDNLPRQEVRYMPNLRQPITGLDVVQETLRMTRRCAKECNQEYGIVSYDLNAAKPALQIQATEKPKFDGVFIMLGTFHIEMAFFKAVGKLISDSGGTNMLTETEVLAPGSLTGFITGKHFNRCKRIHPILALAFEILHFLSFLETYGHKDGIKELVTRIRPSEGEDQESLMKSTEFIACAADYDLYTEETRSEHMDPRPNSG